MRRYVLWVGSLQQCVSRVVVMPSFYFLLTILLLPPTPRSSLLLIYLIRGTQNTLCMFPNKRLPLYLPRLAVLHHHLPSCPAGRGKVRTAWLALPAVKARVQSLSRAYQLSRVLQRLPFWHPRHIQCHGHGPPRSVAGGPVQQMQSPIHPQNSLTNRGPVVRAG